MIPGVAISLLVQGELKVKELGRHEDRGSGIRVDVAWRKIPPKPSLGSAALLALIAFQGRSL